MKRHIISESEKNRILSMHNSRREKNVIYEQEVQQQQPQAIITKIASEGIKNVTPEMIQNPPFPGIWSGYVISGTFNGTKYQWDTSGVQGASGIRGMQNGKVMTENNSALSQTTGQSIIDAAETGVWVGWIKDDNSEGWVCYVTTGGTPTIVKF